MTKQWKTLCGQSSTVSAALNAQASEMTKPVHALVINMQSFSPQ